MRYANSKRSVHSTDLGKDFLLSPGNRIELEVFTQLCELLDTPLSLGAFLRAKYGVYDELTSLGFDPFMATWQGWSRQEFLLTAQICSFFSKYRGFNSGTIDKEAAAFHKWTAAEESCKHVNDVLRRRWGGESLLFPHQVEEVFHLARSKIRRILGTINKDDMSVVRDSCHFGPGSDLSTRGDRVASYEKFRDPGLITPACVDIYDTLFNSDECDVRADMAQHAGFTSSSRLSFVPKNARIDRAICVEPRWNVYVQLGIGTLIANRLRRVGIDIRDQTRNQSLAALAYDKGLATLDLSSASDTVATNLIVDLLSTSDPLWLEFLLKTRCTHTAYKKTSYRLEKISSMGNGYTFPLETLVFYSLALAANEIAGTAKSRAYEYTSVYGDDIIVPSESSALLIETLSFLGFSVNTKKSFVAGSFFESCGKDYYCGKDVRPFFQKEEVTTVTEAYKLANSITDLAIRFIGCGDFAFGKIFALRGLVIRRIPREYRLFGPTSLGDSVIHTTFDDARPKTVRKRGWSGYYFRAIIPRSRPYFGYDYSGLLYSKLGGGTDNGHEITRRDNARYAVGEVYSLMYTDFAVI